MNLLWITENYPPQQGGMAQSADRIVRNLRLSGITIDVLHLSTKHTDIVTEQQLGGGYIAFPLQEELGHSLNLLWLLLAPQLAQYQYIIAFGGYVPIFVAPTLSAWAGVPLVTLLRGNDFDMAIFSPKRYDMLLRCLQSSQKIACVSSDKVPKIKTLLPNSQVFFTPNGINTNTWYALKSDFERAQKWQSNHADKKIIGLFGQLKAKKGLAFLLNSVVQSGVASQLHLLIIGELEQGMHDKLIQEADNQIISFTYVPFAERYALIPYYLACHAVAIPSFYDGMPNVLLEAGALAVPIIAANTAGMADVLTKQTAFLFPPLDFDACRKALFDFVHTPKEQLQTMGKQLQEHIKLNFTEEQEANNYRELLG